MPTANKFWILSQYPKTSFKHKHSFVTDLLDTANFKAVRSIYNSVYKFVKGV
jgi:hypothetical protein